jgi:ATP-dependent Zn protease
MFDTNNILLMSKMMSGNIEIKDLIIYLAIIPLITYVINNFSYLYELILNINNTEKIYIFTHIIAIDYDGSRYSANNPIFCALNYSLINDYNIKIVEYDRFRETYFVKEKNKTKIDNDLYYSVTYNQLSTISKDTRSKITEIILKIYSNKINIEKFIKDKLDKYKLINDAKNFNQVFHIILTNFENNTPNFYNNKLSNKDEQQDLFQHIFSDHNENIINNLNRLSDKKYYQSRGLKRKLGYLFYGPPGCGKTSTVSAISSYTNRHIIEIPMSRIKTNREFETILNTNNINDINTKPHEIILLLDEIDTCENIKIRKNIEEDTEEKEKEIKKLLYKEQNFDLGAFLSRLDGIGNYDGIIIIATTNHIKKLDPAIYRDLRLTPLEFDFVTKNQIIQMIEKYCLNNKSINQSDIIKIPDKNAKLCHSKIRNIIISNNENYDLVINELSKYTT